ncbi:unnamed protein product, partial [Hapterophycus canaliculatus]
QEVDPVDIWSIIGAIGGIWQFMVTGFGLFFVFSVKQAPDRKIRNFRKSVTKVTRPFSSLSSRTSNQEWWSMSVVADIEIDAPEEDLPSEWVKKQRPTGSVYYMNVLTGSTQVVPPHGLSASSIDLHPQPPPPPLLPRRSAMRRVFQGGEDGADSFLPPGWMSREDDKGKTYYMNTVNKTTQWERPTQRVHAAGGSSERPQVVDTPMAHVRRSSNTFPAQARYSPSSSGALGHPASAASTAAAATAMNAIAAASPPPAAVRAPALRDTPAAPSYRTAVHLSNSNAATRRGDGSGGARPRNQLDGASSTERPAAARSTAATGGGVVAEIQTGVPLQKNWYRRTGPSNRT